MNFKKVPALTVCVFLAVSCFAQFNRGKAELKAGDSSITVDYGRPSLKGRDMLSKLAVGSFWRMGSNQATGLTTPVDLTFGSIKIPKGSYSLWLKRTDQEKYELVFNTETGQWGMKHDTSRDVHSIPMKKSSLSSAVETFTIDLKDTPKGGIFTLSWGMTSLSSEFQFAK